MFRFRFNKNGLDDQGRTFEQALTEHMEWCAKWVLRKPEKMYDNLSDEDYISYRSNGYMDLKAWGETWLKRLAKEEKQMSTDIQAAFAYIRNVNLKGV